jgi:hypothetical protein
MGYDTHDEAAVSREFTPDGHWMLIDGRRWRATDPGIPNDLRAELIAELMDARRSVARSRRDGDAAALAATRERVGNAKVALGERGPPWWEELSIAARRVRLAAAIRALARHRAPKTICPSEAARIVGGGAWRSCMVDARTVATDLAERGQIDLLQRNRRIDPAATWRGPLRLRWRNVTADGTVDDKRLESARHERDS